MSNPWGTSYYQPYSQQSSYSLPSIQSKGAPLGGNPTPGLVQGTAPNPYQMNWNPEARAVGLGDARLSSWQQSYDAQNPFAPNEIRNAELATGLERGTIAQVNGQFQNVDYTRNPFESIYSALERASGAGRQTITPGKGNAIPMQGGPQLNDQYFADERARAEKYRAPQYRNAEALYNQVAGLNLDQLKALTYDSSVRDLFQNATQNMANLYANPVAAQQMGFNQADQNRFLQMAYGSLMDRMKQYYLY